MGTKKKISIIWPKIKFILQMLGFAILCILAYVILSPLIILWLTGKTFTKTKPANLKSKFKIISIKNYHKLNQKGLEKAIKAGLSVLDKIKPEKPK